MSHKIKKVVLLLVFCLLVTLFPGCTSSHLSDIEFSGLPSDDYAGLASEQLSNYIGNEAISSPLVRSDHKFTVKSGNKILATYLLPLYSGSKNSAVFQALCFLEADFTQSPCTLSIESDELNQPIFYPTLDFSVKVNTVNITLKAPGNYTFFPISGDESVVLTIRVFQSRSEDELIQDYCDQYGEENVIVLESGLHELDSISIPSHSVLYIKNGCYLMIKHGTKNMNAAIYADSFEDIIIDGRGIIDMSLQDWHECNTLSLLNGKSLIVKDITIINSPNWSLYCYQVSNASIENVVLLGSRTNGDGIDICNCNTVSVDGCLARVGDDCFSVKTLGSSSQSSCHHITFKNCIAWASKARAFGITGEVNYDIYDILFDSSTVIRSDATWNDDRIAALAIVSETGEGNIHNITFRDMNILSSMSEPILISILNNDRQYMNIESVVFENITYDADRNCWFKAGNTTNRISAELIGISANNHSFQSSDYLVDLPDACFISTH